LIHAWARAELKSQGLALRCRIVLACADGRTNLDVARHLGLDRMTVSRWRTRFLTRRVAGLVGEPRRRPSRPATPDQVEAVLAATLGTRPSRAGRWSQRSMARHVGLSPSTIARIWQEFGLAPHNARAVTGLPADSAGDVVGVYLERPHRTVVIAVGPTGSGRVDWSRIGRPRPAPRADHGRVLTHLLTALNIARTAASTSILPRCTDAFCEFLEATASSVAPRHVHAVCDGISVDEARTLTARLAPGAQVQVHVVPSSAWITVVGPWLSSLAGTATHDDGLGRALCSWATTVDTNPSTFVWTQPCTWPLSPNVAPDLRAR
jgi:transcriptional regulator with XRE-family HTH domain